MSEVSQMYFRHDAGASSDPKIIKLEMKHGDTGYCIFWKTLEYLFTQGGKAQLEDMGTIAYVIRKDVDKVREIINDCIDLFHLFAKDDTSFWSIRLTKDIERIKDISKKRKDAGKMPKTPKADRMKQLEADEQAPVNVTNKANAKHMISNSSANGELQTDRQTDKTDKINNTIVHSEHIRPYSKTKGKCSLNEQLEDSFNTFWEAYPRKQTKEQAVKAWRKLSPSPELLNTMLASLDLLKQSPNWLENNGKFIPLPTTWINGKRWEDEVEPVQAPKPTQEPSFAPRFTKTIFDEEAGNRS